MTIEATQTKPWTVVFGLDTGPVPTSGYTSKEFFDREVEQVWNRNWILVGKEHKIPNPGDYFVRELPWANVSVVVVRGHDGVIRAFHNVCAHRCNRLMWDQCGTSRVIRCSFHGWVFGLGGGLVSVPDEENFFDLDKADYGLTGIHCESWDGLIFVNLAEQPAQNLLEYLGPMFVEGLAGFDFGKYTREYTFAAHLNCNWKVLRDAFIEVYHVPTVHQFSFGKSFTSDENPWCHNLHYELSGPHAKFSTFANMNYQPPPMEGLAFVLGGGLESIMDKRGREALPPGVNPTRDENWSADGNIAFPSVGLYTFASFYLQIQWTPVDVDHCIVEASQCMLPPSNATQRWVQEVGNVTFQAGLLEDLRTLEPMQASFKSGAKKEIMLQDHEVAVRHCHHWGQQMAGAYPKE